ncbi:hypothetical protein ACFC25_05570 [Pseudarthrobacter sp. NPDC055928]|uniref:hypothetical protein n=1 Tax=Pseudarthrobacter sp. NPDC055928 TaxID=3345661 RepID=UPI0035DD1EA2
MSAVKIYATDGFRDVLVWALAGLRGTGQRGYQIAILVSLAALVMNVGILLASLSVGTVVPEPGPAVKIS